tara:strand:- start:136 stop:486 length:351 start_codon:yes stop_codon:yes gene_type:complete
MEDRIIKIEKTLSSLETSVKDIRYDIQRVREDSQKPTWLKTAGVFVCLALFANVVSSVWWASKITSIQQQIIKDVEENTEFIATAMNQRNEIMIELNKLTITLDLLSDNMDLLDVQ